MNTNNILANKHKSVFKLERKYYHLLGMNVGKA